jgi:hypothetical protein
MGSYTSVLRKDPQMFAIRGNQASIQAREHEIQPIIDNFKNWLPQASRVYRSRLESAAREHETRRREQLRLERVAEEERLRIRRGIRI